jgi:cellulose synthase operon protein C
MEPPVRVDCYQCNAVYEIPVESLGPGGVRAECPRCNHQQTLRREHTQVRKVLGEAADEAEVADDRDALFDFSKADPPAPPPRPPPLPPRLPPRPPTTSAPAAPSPAAPPVVPPPAEPAAPPAAPLISAPAVAPAPDPFDDDPFADVPDEPVEAPVDDLLDEIAGHGPGRGSTPPEGPAGPPAAPAPAGGSSFDFDDAQPFAAEAGIGDPAPTTGPDLGDPFGSIDDLAPPPSAATAFDRPAAPEPAAPSFESPPASGPPADTSPPASPPARPGEYRVKKPSGQILGPFPLITLEAMAEKGELAPGDQLARDQDEFRLLSQYDECAPLLEKAARRHRVQTSKPVYRKPPPRRGPKIVAALLVLALGGGVAVWFVAPDRVPDPIRTSVEAALARLGGGGEEVVVNPVHADLGLFRLQVVDLDGAAPDHLARAEALMAEDLPASYGEADLSLKRALLLAPDDPAVLGRFLVNGVLLHRWESEPVQLQRWLAYARYLEEVAPDEPVALQGRAAVASLLGGQSAAEARRLARRAVDARPDDPFGLLVLGRATAGVDHRAAVSKLGEWAARSDAPTRIHLELAHACRLAGDFACADASLRRRLAHAPDHEEAIAQLVALHVLVGGYDEAESLYQALLDRDPGRADAALALAILDYQLAGRIGPARQRVDGALALRGEHLGEDIDRRLRVHGATLARLEGATQRAEQLLDEVFEHDPHDGAASYQAVLLALAAGDAEKAATHLPAAIATIDHPARRALLRALVQSARGNLDDAVREARRAIDAWPDSLEPVLFAASLEGRRGQSRQAYLLLRQSLGRDPTEVHRNRSLTEYWDGRELEAAIVAGFEALVAREPHQGMAHAAHGAGLWLAGDAAGARAALRRALEHDDRSFPALVYLGVLSYEAGRLRPAADALEQAARIDGLAPLPQYLLGRVAERQGRSDEALLAYRDALRRDAAFHPAQVRAAVLDAERDPDRSREILRRVAASRPDNVAARAALFEIGQ